MKSIALVTALVAGSLSQMAPAASETETLRSRCAEQERQIKELEKELDSLHALLAKQNGTRQSVTATASRMPSPAAAQDVSSRTYKVRKGDSLSSIARKHGVKLEALMAANSGINPNRLQIGQSIKLPQGDIPKAIAVEEDKGSAVAKTAPASSYTVKKGDTLYSIARNNGTTVSKLMAANGNLKANNLQVGQKINLHGATATARTNSKPAPASVSKKPAAKPAPVAKKEAPKPAPVAKKPIEREQVQQVKHTPAQPKVRTVTVNRQMSFGEFAKQHDTSVAQINEMNGLQLTSSTILATGSELYIPSRQH